MIQNPIKAIVFDYGNTLIEFADDQLHYCDTALAACLEKMFGELDHTKLKAIRNKDRRSPYRGEFKENNLAEISRALVQQLYDCEPTAEQVQCILDVRYDSFIEVVRHEPIVEELLEQWGKRYKLGLLSNYPCGQAIRESLQRLDLSHFFDAVVVSGDVGRVKPHPLPFQTVLEQLGVNASEAIYIGDNWLGDIQGAKRIGMAAVYTQQWDTPEKFDKQPGDFEPDAVIGHLSELKEYV